MILMLNYNQLTGNAAKQENLTGSFGNGYNYALTPTELLTSSTRNYTWSVNAAATLTDGMTVQGVPIIGTNFPNYLTAFSKLAAYLHGPHLLSDPSVPKQAGTNDLEFRLYGPRKSLNWVEWKRALDNFPTNATPKLRNKVSKLRCDTKKAGYVVYYIEITDTNKWVGFKDLVQKIAGLNP